MSLSAVYTYTKNFIGLAPKRLQDVLKKKNIKPGIYLQKNIRNTQKVLNSHFAVATVNIYTLVAMQGRFAAGIARDNKALVHTNIDWFRASPV